VSVVDDPALAEVTRRSDAVLHVVLEDASLLAEDKLQDYQCLLVGLCRPTCQCVIPIPRHAPMHPKHLS
jgi:hypothetical protein